MDIFPNLGQKARSQVYEKRLQVIERTKPIAKLPRKFDPNYKRHKITIMTDTQTEESETQQIPNNIENSHRSTGIHNAMPCGKRASPVPTLAAHCGPTGTSTCTSRVPLTSAP